MWFLVALYGSMALIWWAVRKSPAIVRAWLEMAFALLLFFGAPIYSAVTRYWELMFLCALLWAMAAVAILLDLAPPRLEPIDDLADFAEELAQAATIGFTEVRAFRRLAPIPRRRLLWFQHPQEASVLMLLFDSRSKILRLWSYSNTIGNSEGRVVTTPVRMGMFRFAEIRQIVMEETDHWELHRDALAVLADHGIDTRQRVNESVEEHLTSLFREDRRSLLLFPLTIFTMIARVPFHVGPLRGRRGLRRQLRRFSRNANGLSE